jgi:thiamine biosynthesis lipoprotein
MVREVEATEARLSTWRGTSELAALNATPVGAWRAVTPELAGELRRALACAAATDGAFDPTVGALVEAWGLRTGGAVPTAALLATARARTGWRGVELEDDPPRARRVADVRLEEGGFGKGEALDHALDRFEQSTRGEGRASARLDFGGQVAWSGARWPVEVELADPRDRARPVLALALAGERGSISTSGDGERRFVSGERTFGHLLDPRTGEPARDFGSASVVAARASRADCLSTGLFVRGPGRAAADGAEIFLVVEGGRLVARVAPELKGTVRPLIADLAIAVTGGSSS